MSLRFARFSSGLFLCLTAFLLLNHKVWALDKKTSDSISHYIMGIVYQDLGDTDKAIEEYKNALKTDNEASLIHLNLAASLIKKNDLPQAVEELKTTVKLDPEAIEPHAILALLYSTQEKADLAAAEYEIALKNAAKINPKNLEIYKSLGALYIQQKKYKDARETYKLAVELAPSDASARFYLGSIYSELKERDLAVKELKEALKLKSDYHEALNYLGYLYVERGENLEEAEALIRKALELQSNNGAYIDSLGWLYFKQGKAQEALKQLEKASSLIEDPVVYDHLGDVYCRLGQLDKARESWQKSLNLDDKQDKVKEKIIKIDNLCNTAKAK